MSKLVAYQMAMSLEGAINSVRQLYGNDIRIGYSSLSELIAFEGNQSKENLVSSDDESFVPNMIKAASRLFDTDTEYIWFSLQTVRIALLF